MYIRINSSKVYKLFIYTYKLFKGILPFNGFIDLCKTSWMASAWSLRYLLYCKRV